MFCERVLSFHLQVIKQKSIMQIFCWYFVGGGKMAINYYKKTKIPT